MTPDRWCPNSLPPLSCVFKPTLIPNPRSLLLDRRVIMQPSPFLEPGDRFIPTRSLMDIRRAQSCLIPFEKKKKKQTQSPPRSIISPSRDEYIRRVEENMRLDSEGMPYRMLEFRGSPRDCRKNRLGIEEEQESPGYRRKVRNLPKSATKILDATNLIDDYYLKLMDWGKNKYLAVALGNSVHLWHEETSKVQLLLTTDMDGDHPTSVAWSSDQKTLAVGFAESRIEIWDVVAARRMQVINRHTARVGTLSWNCNILTSGSQDYSILNHDVRVLTRPASYYRGHRGEVCGLQWSERGKQLASGANDNLVHVWESTNSSKFLHRFRDHSAAVRAISWCPFECNVMASGGGSTDRSIKIWNTSLGKCINSIDTGSQVCALEWNRHQKEILSAHGYLHNKLSLWAYPSMSKIVDFTGYYGRVLHLSQNADGSTVASAATDGTIRFWKMFEPPPCSKSDDSDSPLSLKRMHIR